MENASKALIMAAGVLIGILILSLAVFLFTDFGAKSKGIYTQIEQTQLTQYNAQYTIYSGRNDVTIYEIVSLANLAKENNDYYKDYSNYESEYKVIVILQGQGELQTKSEADKQDLIKNYNISNSGGELMTCTFECARNRLS